MDGTIPQGKYMLNYLHSFDTFPYWFASSVKSYNLNQQTSILLPSLHLGKTLCYISELYTIKFKIVFKKYSKEPQKSTLNQHALYSKVSCRISKQHTHAIYGKIWDTKLKSGANFVKGLHHLCPCHQPNPHRGLVTYTR